MYKYIILFISMFQCCNIHGFVVMADDWFHDGKSLKLFSVEITLFIIIIINYFTISENL